MERDWFAEAASLIDAAPADEEQAEAFLERHRALLRALLADRVERALAGALRDRAAAGVPDRGFGQLGLLGELLEGASVALEFAGDARDDDEAPEVPRAPGWHASLFDPTGRQIGWGRGDNPEQALSDLTVIGPDTRHGPSTSR